MKKLIMYVYGDITTDARVNRAANALANNFDITLLSTQFGKKVEDGTFKNILIGTNKTGFKNLFTNIYEAYKIIKKAKPEVVYCHDYYSAILAWMLICSNFQGRIIYDAHELIIPEPGISDRRLSFFRWFEKRIVKKVDLLVNASQERGELMKQYYKLDKAPLAIRNISQLDVNDDADTKLILQKLDNFFATQKPTVVYAGVVTSSRRIMELEEAVSQLATNFKLLIVGQGDALEEIKVKAAENKELTFAYTGKIPYKSLGAVLAKCDIGFVYYPTNTLNNTYCASNKIYEYASVSLPMVSNNNPTVKKELKEFNLGIAMDDIVSALRIVGSNLEQYKAACNTYTKNNPWEKDAELLLSYVLKLI